MKCELESLKKNGVIELVTLPRDVRPISGKWVYRIKVKPDGSIMYKSRYVARGFTQKKYVDYEETYSPVISFSILS